MFITNTGQHFIGITVIGTPRPKYYPPLPPQYQAVPPGNRFQNTIVCSLEEMIVFSCSTCRVLVGRYDIHCASSVLFITSTVIAALYSNPNDTVSLYVRIGVVLTIYIYLRTITEGEIFPI